MSASKESSLSISEAFAVYSSSRTAIIQIWTFFSLVTLGLLGFTLGAEKPITRSGIEIGLIVAGYVAFAFGNAWAVVGSQAELLRIAEGIDELMAGNPHQKKHFSVAPIPPMAIALFYVVMTVVVSCAIIVRLNTR